MQEIQQLIEREVKAGKTPSVQYYLFTKDEILEEFRYGLADVEKKTTVTADHSYNAYSVTKTFTALAILQLAERKILNLCDCVVDHLPNFPYGHTVTIRHLLNHTAGVPNPIPLSWIHLSNEHCSFNAAAFFKTIIDKYKKPKAKPGERFAYSNLGYIFLGQIIEKLTGKRYEDYINEFIIDKLSIDSSELGFETTVLSRQARGCHKRFSFTNLILGLFIDKRKYMDKAVGNWKPFKPFYVNGAPYGGLIGKPSAFVKYIQALLKSNCQLLSSQYTKLLFQEYKLNNGKKTGMCISWFKGELNGRTYFAHAGGGGGYYCEIRIYPEHNIGSVVFFNRTGMTDERFLDKVDASYFAEIESSTRADNLVYSL
ncbi:serine hydrolase domain-containing protein [Lacibacter sediminis]|uniref:Beta-lactamase family protein n=1 Tax=Lacibacter sediminis TaxID=2760713 RepID=A0A7G5XMA5_9BACT|nr:serine hydrolase domain-containing protein [Lacibacter sediminis]QNA46608.1 beta-lactamase family protein [Lacibacter sediminis]